MVWDNSTENVLKKIYEIERYTPIDISELEQLVKEDPHGNATWYIVDRMFGNGLSRIPNKFKDMLESYFALAVYYFKNRNIENKSDDSTLNVTDDISNILGLLLNSTQLPRDLGESEVYKQIARKIMQFYHENRDNTQLLHKVGKALFGMYLCLGQEPEEWSKAEKHYDISILRNLAVQPGIDLKNPSIVRIIWERVKETYTK